MENNQNDELLNEKVIHPEESDDNAVKQETPEAVPNAEAETPSAPQDDTLEKSNPFPTKRRCSALSV